MVGNARGRTDSHSTSNNDLLVDWSDTAGPFFFFDETSVYDKCSRMMPPKGILEDFLDWVLGADILTTLLFTVCCPFEVALSSNHSPQPAF